MRRDFVAQISIFSMPRCLGSESPSRLPTGLCVIVVFLVSDRGFVLDFVRGHFSTCLWHLALQSGHILFVSAMLMVLFLLFLLRFLCFVVASPCGFASSFGV